MLFLLYINDLPLHVTSKVRLYTDDVILYSHIYSEDECHILQKDLWSNTWQMMFNPKNVSSFVSPTRSTSHLIAITLPIP